MAKTRAQMQRALRQEELRTMLAKKGLVEQVVKNLEKIDQLDEECESFSNALKKLQVSNDQRMALIKKYLPDMHHSSIEGDSEDGSITINLVSYADKPTK
jgi:hypothetical protein